MATAIRRVGVVLVLCVFLAGSGERGLCHAQAAGAAKDHAGTVERFRKLAEEGNPSAQFNLGLCYARGFGVEKDEAEAVTWYRKAAGQGHPDAQFNLGLCYYRGNGVAKDAGEAVLWFRKAAEQGHPSAQNNLGGCYAQGVGVAKDVAEAANWFRKAAEQGEAEAQNNLGGMLRARNRGGEGRNRSLRLDQSGGREVGEVAKGPGTSGEENDGGTDRGGTTPVSRPGQGHRGEDGAMSRQSPRRCSILAPLAAFEARRG